MSFARVQQRTATAYGPRSHRRGFCSASCGRQALVQATLSTVLTLTFTCSGGFLGWLGSVCPPRLLASGSFLMYLPFPSRKWAPSAYPQQGTEVSCQKRTSTFFGQFCCIASITCTVTTPGPCVPASLHSSSLLSIPLAPADPSLLPPPSTHCSKKALRGDISFYGGAV